jgi:uncharacterized protein (DUF58 family)
MANKTTDPPRRALFDEDFLRKLEYLHLVAQKLQAGLRRADRRSKKLGSGLEYADHRDYAPGDDFRTIDWNVYGRSEKLLVRLFEEEEDLSVYILVDLSRSMGLFSPSKADYAMRLAAALAYLSLASLDRVSMVTLSDGLGEILEPTRGKGQIQKILGFLERQTPGGKTQLEVAVREFSHRFRRRGVIIVISDFYDEAGFEEALRLLRYQRFEVRVLQVTDDRELEASLRGDLRLVDCESGAFRDVTITPALLKKFQAAHEEFSQEIQSFCKSLEMPYARTSIQTPFEDAVLSLLRQGGFLR